MARRKFREVARYRAGLALGFLEQFASNELISSRFTRLRFTDVIVPGDGGNRVVEVHWPLPDAEGEMPSQVVELREI